MLVMCKITVTVLVLMGGEKIPWQVKTDAEGTVVKEGPAQYVADFSKPAKENNWQGEYSKVLVDKNKCVRMGK